MQRQLAAQCPLKAQISGQAQRTFKHVEVMNFGCDGYGTAQELITLSRHVWSYSPDVIVLTLFTGNDIRNNSVVLEGDKCRPFFVYRNGNLWEARSRIPGRSGFIACSGSSRAVCNFSMHWGPLAAS
jgi:hypothetical protein